MFLFILNKTMDTKKMPGEWRMNTFGTYE